MGTPLGLGGKSHALFWLYNILSEKKNGLYNILTSTIGGKKKEQI